VRKPDPNATAGSGDTNAQSGSANPGGSSGSGNVAGSSAGKSGSGGGSSGSGSVGGGNAGGAGKPGSSGQELAASLTACNPKCPDTQYCSLVEVDCSGPTCLVNAVCKDRPTCSKDTQFMCPKSPMETCEDDPTTDCNPDDPGCTGICRCTENAMPCAPKALDRRPGVCACVDMQGTTEFCSELDCPVDAKCTIELGKGYCVVK
jgi:hypothetical protein